MGKRRLRHPEARIDEMRAKASHESEVRVPQKGWSWSYGWLVSLREPNGARHYRHVPTYAEAVKVREEEMATGAYEVAWVIQSSYKPATVSH